MFYKIKNLLIGLVPEAWLSAYHLSLAHLGALAYGRPSRKLVIIGVTGTSGKSTTAFILHNLLQGAGYKVGSLSTIAFRIGDWFQLNDQKMTMLGRFQTQKFLARMVKAGCRYAIVETTSQGIEQFRHRGIHYDLVLFTNLHPEHLEAHGGFENYKKAKLKLFHHVAMSPMKQLQGVEIPRVIVVNGDDDHASAFLNFPVEEKYAYTLEGRKVDGAKVLAVQDIDLSPRGTHFKVEGHDFSSPLRGYHNLKNVAAALTVGRASGLSWKEMQRSVAELPAVPGRLEYINEGQPWDVIVDYAFEPRAMENLYVTIRPFGYRKIIQVFGGTGGGRDKARRPVLGKMAGEFADIVIITDEDPYDEDPREIMDQVRGGVLTTAKKEDFDFFMIEDRRLAIRKALLLAEPGTLILITGKGSEQAMVKAGGKLIPWDDRTVVKEEIQKLTDQEEAF